MLTVHACRLVAVARDERTLRLGPSDRLSVMLSVDQRSSVTFRLGIALDVPGASPDHAKYAELIAWEPNDAKGVNDPPAWNIDLGCWRWDTSSPTELELTEYPLKVRRLAWMPLQAKAMGTWIEPWRFALDRLVCELATEGSLLAAMATDLVIGWPRFTIGELVARVDRFSRYLGDPTDVLGIAGDSFEAETTNLDAVPTESLPREIATRLAPRQARPATEHELAEPGEVCRSWSGDFLTLEFPRILPPGVLELRVPADTALPITLFCHVGNGFGAGPVTRTKRGDVAVYSLRTFGVAGCCLPVTISPVPIPDGVRNDVQIWLRSP